MKYCRTRGEPIEAVQWSIEQQTAHPGVFYEFGRFYVITIDGQTTTLADGDWILPEPDGVHFFPCKPDIFAKVYELAGDEQIVHIPGVVSNREPTTEGLPTCEYCGARVFSPCSEFRLISGPGHPQYTNEEITKVAQRVPATPSSWAEENLPTPTTLEAAIRERNAWVDSAMQFARDHCWGT